LAIISAPRAGPEIALLDEELFERGFHELEVAGLVSFIVDGGRLDHRLHGSGLPAQIHRHPVVPDG
jgi:hypothetical protein